MAEVYSKSGVTFSDPPFVQALFGTHAGPGCGYRRVWLGYNWLQSGWGKLNNPGWIRPVS